MEVCCATFKTPQNIVTVILSVQDKTVPFKHLHLQTKEEAYGGVVSQTGVTVPEVLQSSALSSSFILSGLLHLSPPSKENPHVECCFSILIACDSCNKASSRRVKLVCNERLLGSFVANNFSIGKREMFYSFGNRFVASKLFFTHEINTFQISYVYFPFEALRYAIRVQLYLNLN